MDISPTMASKHRKRRSTTLVTREMHFFFFFKESILFIYLYLAAPGLHCCASAFSSCGEQGLLLVAVRGLLRLSSCGAWAQLLCGMRDPLGPGLEPMSPALAGGLLTTAPPGKPEKCKFKIQDTPTYLLEWQINKTKQTKTDNSKYW